MDNQQQDTITLHNQQQQDITMQNQLQQEHQSQDPRHPEHEWQSSLFNCAPCGTCLLSSFLPCILIGRTSGRMRDPSMETFEEFNSECLAFCGIQCLTGCGWIYSMMKRGEIRDRYGIKGSDCEDCAVSFCCSCCAMIQQDKEVKWRTAGLAPITQGYQSQKEGLQMPAPMMQPEHQPEHQDHRPMQQPPMQQPPI
ncbi:hypothetical protein G6O67_008432 [Ophiocordyceps sinensis]|uniref:PLAC8 family protein n=2 Tax=Ophiocordyceps sinensis TaxID=72228 RepID=A0A8H4LRD0_9HYPO|nr:PLAC8 family protein [Ophiocordyceps sinensis CO18]KAF4504259.1 hypothetical protein G6O67_008432 [Ophiocordyceps sinensis]